MADSLLVGALNSKNICINTKNIWHHMKYALMPPVGLKAKELPMPAAEVCQCKVEKCCNFLHFANSKAKICIIHQLGSSCVNECEKVRNGKA